MNKLIKWVLVGGLGFVGLIIVILLILPFFVNVNQYKPYVEQKVSEATGRPFQILIPRRFQGHFPHILRFHTAL